MKYSITGMSCAACQARIEKAVSKIYGVTNCSVSLLTNQMTVDGNVDSDIIIKTVNDIGYTATICDKPVSIENFLEDKETPILKRRLCFSLIFLFILLYFSMGNMIFHFPMGKVFIENPILIGIMQMVLAFIIMVINKKFFISGFKSITKLSPNMDTLVAMGSMVSFLWSVCVLFKMTTVDVVEAKNLLGELYFESAAMILTLITIGKLLETHSKGKTTNAIKTLIKLSPRTVHVIRENREQLIDIDDITINDIFLVYPGENIPVDGIIIDGITTIDESALTGESIPVDKKAGDNIYTATTNKLGFIKCKAIKVGEDTVLSQIIKMVSEVSATKAPIAKIADKVSSVFVPVVIGIAFITFIVWILNSASIDFALARAISVLVISCPCALGLATPVAIMVGSGVGAKNGILFKTAESLEMTGKAKIVTFDKTGTITKGEPKVVDIITNNNIEKNKLLQLAYSIERKSEHPLAKAIITKAKIENIEGYEVSDFKIFSEGGIYAKCDDELIYAGKKDFILEKTNIDKKDIEKLSENIGKGQTELYFVRNNVLYGIITVSDEVKSESKEAVEELYDMGIETVLLTGDNVHVAKDIGRQVGIKNIIAEVLPDGKNKIINKLKKFGKTIMVGDGINDAIALVSADIGIAIGKGTDVAIDSADIVLMNSRLSDVPTAIRLSKATIKNIYENLFWAFFYNIICIPLAAGLYIYPFGLKLNPMIAALAMSLSSCFVVLNALRLNLFDVHKKQKSISKSKIDLKSFILENRNDEKEEKVMTKTMKIEGMMCEHCEGRVVKVLKEIDGVLNVVADHNKGIATIELTKNIDNDILKMAVSEQGYKVLGIE